MRQHKAISKKLGGPIPSATRQAEMLIELPDGMWDRISHKAYDLWVQRGCQEGNALRDWFDAEEIVMEEIHEARE
ncbi:MAG: DUF2934 domain-containing protein [Nitrospira sp.]|nr:DUF2934 domain-containing protein [Nitrospira sp.]